MANAVLQMLDGDFTVSKAIEIFAPDSVLNKRLATLIPPVVTNGYNTYPFVFLETKEIGKVFYALISPTLPLMTNLFGPDSPLPEKNQVGLAAAISAERAGRDEWGVVEY